MAIQQKTKRVKHKNSAHTKETVIARIRSVGNSKGVILNNHLLKVAGINTEDEIAIAAGDGVITISQAKQTINTDLKSWDAQFKKAIKGGHRPEKNLFEGLENSFDKTEW